MRLLRMALALTVAIGSFIWLAIFVLPALDGGSTHPDGQPFSIGDYVLGVLLGGGLVLGIPTLLAIVPLRLSTDPRFKIAALLAGGWLAVIALGLMLVGGFLYAVPAAIILYTALRHPSARS